jgi:hypothetical protein
LTGAIEIAQVTLVSTNEFGVTVSESAGLLSTMRIGVPVLKAKKKLAPPCTRQDPGAKEYVFDVYPGTIQVPYSDAMTWPSIFCARTWAQQNASAISARSVFKIGSRLPEGAPGRSQPWPQPALAAASITDAFQYNRYASK